MNNQTEREAYITFFQDRYTVYPAAVDTGDSEGFAVFQSGAAYRAAQEGK